jgi:hypothetical protein
VDIHHLTNFFIIIVHSVVRMVDRGKGKSITDSAILEIWAGLDNANFLIVFGGFFLVLYGLLIGSVLVILLGLVLIAFEVYAFFLFVKEGAAAVNKLMGKEPTPPFQPSYIDVPSRPGTVQDFPQHGSTYPQARNAQPVPQHYQPHQQYQYQQAPPPSPNPYYYHSPRPPVPQFQKCRACGENLTAERAFCPHCSAPATPDDTDINAPYF